MRHAAQRTRNAGGLLSAIIEDAFAILLVGLVALGAGGLVYRIFSPDGWVSAVLGQLWSKSPWMVWATSFSAAVLALLIKHNVERRASRPGAGNFLVYLLASLGILFGLKRSLTGAL